MVSFIEGCAFTVASPWLKGRYDRWEERTGALPFPEIVEPVVWFHGVSVGEVQAAWPVAKALRDAGYDGVLAVSAVTRTGMRTAMDLMGGLADLFLAYPWDKRGWVRGFLDRLRPWVYVAFETEMWPTLIWEAKSRGVKLVLANGRVSDRSFRGMMRLRGLYGDLLGCFDAVFPRGSVDGERLLALGVPEGVLREAGDVKADGVWLRRLNADLSGYSFRGDLFVAGSTHPGEEEEVLRAFLLARSAGFGGLRLALVPRHPERAGDCLRLCRDRGLRAELFSEDPSLCGDFEVVVVDRVGVLFSLYGLASAAFVGGSLVPKGGQNVMEPAVWGVPVMFGPHMEDFVEQRDRLLESRLGFEVLSGDEMGERLIELLGLRCRISSCGALFGSGDEMSASRRVASEVLGLLEGSF
ncbi:3-deoxy-D-manno-octulosonic acid transferase [Thermanaerovibrio velox]|uniref:3-deoxy-D-manno-octulosonic acid transferase n=1 Tax=Thermanaerovibrio velox TaxID=108007 RepID=UPI001FE20208|nr:glycosyltransferase N-terminal domain-containing protein [Thermanaerovibrio velox]